MSYHLVIDIETVPQDNVDLFVLDYFKEIRWDKIEDLEEQEKMIMSDLCIHPSLARVFCCVLRSNDMVEKIVGKEQEVLKSFWSMIDTCYREYKDIQFVTFNGISFDFPFLERRSAILNLKFLDLPKNRWRPDQHFDVRLALTSVSPYKLGNLLFWAKVHGIDIKEDLKNVQVYDMYKAGKFDDIVDRCVEDTRVTQELYFRNKPKINPSTRRYK